MFKSTTFVIYLAATILLVLVFSAKQQQVHAFTPTTQPRASHSFGLTTTTSSSSTTTPGIASPTTSSNTALFAVRKGEGNNKQVAKKKKLPIVDVGPLAIFSLASFFVAVDFAFLHTVFNK